LYYQSLLQFLPQGIQLSLKSLPLPEINLAVIVLSVVLLVVVFVFSGKQKEYYNEKGLDELLEEEGDSPSGKRSQKVISNYDPDKKKRSRPKVKKSKSKEAV